MKKTALLLSLVLIITALGIGASALISNGFECKENDDGTLTLDRLEYSIASGEVTVPESINGRNITRIGINPFSYKQFITGVTLPSTIDVIADKAFYMCVGLEKIVVPEGVESVGDNCFNLCEALEEITLPRSAKSIGKELFTDCKALKTAYIYCEGAALGDDFFLGCESLESIYLSKDVKSLSASAVESCSALTDIYCQGTAEDTLIDDSIEGITVHYEYEYEEFPVDIPEENTEDASSEVTEASSGDNSDGEKGSSAKYILIAAGIAVIAGASAAVIKKKKK